jgi:hypothetical protein
MSGRNGERGRSDTHRRAHKDSHRRLDTGEPEEYARTKVHAEVFVPVERPAVLMDARLWHETIEQKLDVFLDRIVKHTMVCLRL